MYLRRYHDVADQPVRGVAHPQAARAEPAAGLAALQAAQPALEALREAAPRPPGPGRRQVHRAHRRRPPQALPVHRHRRLHPDPGAADLPPQQPEDRDPVHRLRPGQAAVRGRVRPDRQRRRVPRRLPLAPARPRHRPRLHQAPRPHASTARSSDPTASTPRSSTDSSTASSSTTPACSTTSSKNGRTSTTSTDPTAASMDRPPTNDYDRRPRPRPRKRASVSCTLRPRQDSNLRHTV